MGDVFWSLAEDPRGALRWALSKIRPLINDSECERLDADRERVALIASDVEIDVVDYAKRVDDPNTAVAELRAISESLQEPFLDGLDLPDLELFQRWLIAEREDVKRLRGKVLSRLASHPEILLPEQLRWAHEWEEVDPYNTDAARRLVDLLNAMGEKQRADGLKMKFSSRFKNAGICWSPSSVLQDSIEPVEAVSGSSYTEGARIEENDVKATLPENPIIYGQINVGEGATISTISRDGLGGSPKFGSINNNLRDTRSNYLKQLEEENRRLKKLVAELSLDKAMLQDAVARKNDNIFSESLKKISS